MPACPTGWRRYGDKCYLHVRNSLTWAKAEQSCRSMNSRLASVHDETTSNYLAGIIGSGKYAWLGGKTCSSVWTWSDCSPHTFSFSLSSTSSQKCIILHANTNHWHYYDCDAQRYYLCQRDICSGDSSSAKVYLETTHIPYEMEKNVTHIE